MVKYTEHFENDDFANEMDEVSLKELELAVIESYDEDNLLEYESVLEEINAVLAKSENQ